MKTIQIPLELAEEILRVTDYMTDNSNSFIPEYYHKLKKIVENHKLTREELKARYESFLHPEHNWFLIGEETQKPKIEIHGGIPEGCFKVKNLAELNDKKGICAFVESTGESYWYENGEWVIQK